MSPEVVSRKDAKTQGLTYYFTGKPCKWEHVAKRLVSSCVCVECNKITSKKYTDNGYFKNNYLNNREHRLKTIKTYAQTHPDKVLKASKEWNARNKDQQDQYRDDFYKDVDNKKQFLDSCKVYRKANPAQYQYYASMRRAQKLKATPMWLSDIDKQEIQTKYEVATKLTETTGVLHVVDHYYPLQGDTVSGLHCPANLVVITYNENSKKHNKHPDVFYS